MTSSSFHFYLIDCKVFLNLHEGFNLLQVGYCSWLLLLCLITLWSPVFEARMPQSGTYLHIIFPGGAIACLHINCLQEPDPGIILPVMSLTIISFLMVLITIYSIPNKWKMLQVFYTGGSKVSLHDAPTSSSPWTQVSPSCHDLWRRTVQNFQVLCELCMRRGVGLLGTFQANEDLVFRRFPSSVKPT